MRAWSLAVWYYLHPFACLDALLLYPAWHSVPVPLVFTSGPVRHFMELVVTGLSRNPNYSAKEKRDYVLRFKTYFSQFSPEELQSVPVTRKEVAIQ